MTYFIGPKDRWALRKSCYLFIIYNKWNQLIPVEFTDWYKTWQTKQPIFVIHQFQEKVCQQPGDKVYILVVSSKCQKCFNLEQLHGTTIQEKREDIQLLSSMLITTQLLFIIRRFSNYLKNILKNIQSSNPLRR